jgi:hypothetical protein
MLATVLGEIGCSALLTWFDADGCASLGPDLGP